MYISLHPCLLKHSNHVSVQGDGGGVEYLVGAENLEGIGVAIVLFV